MTHFTFVCIKNQFTLEIFSLSRSQVYSSGSRAYYEEKRNRNRRGSFVFSSNFTYIFPAYEKLLFGMYCCDFRKYISEHNIMCERNTFFCFIAQCVFFHFIYYKIFFYKILLSSRLTIFYSIILYVFCTKVHICWRMHASFEHRRSSAEASDKKGGNGHQQAEINLASRSNLN